MSTKIAIMQTLPPELQMHIISFCDFPTLITLLCVNSRFNVLAQRYTSDAEARTNFLLSYESSDINRNYKLPGDARQTVEWHELYSFSWQSKKLYICFLCNKLRRPEKFAQGQCYRMMLSPNYSSLRQRFCIDCGVSRQPRKYLPGSMIRSNLIENGGYVHLCGDCGIWTTDFYCMKDKKCFSCTEKDLEEPERHVEGFELLSDQERSNGEPGKLGATDRGVSFPKRNEKNEERSWPRRPPCCRSCGGHWRYTPTYFGVYLASGAYERRYVISGTSKSKISLIPDVYMRNFCPFPF